MRFGLFTSGYQRENLETAFRDAAQFGYDYIELWGGRPHAFAPDLLAGEWENVARLIQKYDMPVEIYTPEHNAYPYNYMLGDENQRKDCVRYLTTAMHAAKAIGAEYTLVSCGHGGNRSAADRFERLLHTMEELVTEAEKLDHIILLETLTPFESNTCTSLSGLHEILDAVNSPYLLGMCDVVAPFSQGEDPVDYIRVLKSRMAHLHFVDSDGISDTHLIPGEGIMPLRRILRGFQDEGYDGRATIELVTNYIDTPSQSAKLALDKARELL